MTVESNQHIVIVGASLGGVRTAQNLRRMGYEGRVSIVGDERHLPYDRPPLSKAALTDDIEPSQLNLIPADTYDDLSIDLVLGTPASALDLAARSITVGDQRMPFDGLVIASGARARTLPGAADIEGVHTLRTLDDAMAIRASMTPGARVLVVGAGFIGSEVAAAAHARGCHTTVVEAASAPLTRGLGPSMGAAIGTLHGRHGVDLLLGRSVSRLHAGDRIEAVELDDGSRLDADLVVVGIGVTPNTDWLDGSGLRIDNGVLCDVTLNAGAEGVFAIGDVARAPNMWVGPDAHRVEHWTAAVEHGMLVAHNLLEPQQLRRYDSVPFVWSDQYEARIQIAGQPSADDEVVMLIGSPEDDAFVAGYRRGDHLVGVVSLNAIKPFVRLRRLLVEHPDWDQTMSTVAELAG